MESRIRTLVVLGLLFLGQMAYAQTSPQAGLVSAKLTISPGRLLVNPESELYLHGALAYYISERLSISGDGFLFINASSSEDWTVLDQNHQLFFGAYYHLGPRAHDLYFGFQPGIAFSKPSGYSLIGFPYQTAVTPLVAIPLGYNFFVNRYFHFFAQTRLVLGQHVADEQVPLHEWRISAGLGLNLAPKN